MKKSICTLLLILIVASVNVIRAQSLETILEKHFQAVGQDKIVGAGTFFMKAKISQMGMEFPMEMKMKRPDKFRLEMEMQGQKMIQAYDGEKGWMIAPWLSPDPQELVGDQLKQAMNQANFEGELYDYKKKGHAMEFAGKVNLEGKEAYRIKLSAKDGSIENYFIDAETYLISKVKSKVSAMGQEVAVEKKMSDYKDFNGVFMATKMESVTPMGNMNIIIEEFKIDQKFDDAIFVQPVK
ncbi:MAG: hypothetical protein HQ522_23090 [Bacteroidetes bacterium]|nr:hypothetical protein [Bacteroidota bacterium]